MSRRPGIGRRELIAGALTGAAGLVMSGPRAAAAVTVPVRKGYASGRFGQMHYRVSQPSVAAGHPPLLCLHSTPNSGRIYETFLTTAGTDRFVIAPDTPGYGDSDPPAAPPSIADYAAAMIDLLDAFGFEQADVMGYHTGSATAIELALAAPDRIRHLVLISAPIITGAERASFEAEFAGPVKLRADGSHLAEQWQLYRQWAMDGWNLADRFGDSLRRPDISWWGYAAVFDYPVAARLQAVQQPVLVLNPDDDLHEQTLRAKDRLRTGRLQPLPGWSHGFLDLYPVQAAALVRRFLDAREP